MDQKTTGKKRKKPAAGYRHVERVEVFMWDTQIGAVALDPKYGYYAFAYAEDFRGKGIEPSPLHMPVTSGPYIFTDLPIETYKKLPAMLSDVLPDDFGNALIDKYMAEKGISDKDITPLDRLAYMSNRAMGALTFKPARGPAKRTPTAIELSALVTEARKAVKGTIDDDDQTNAALRSIIDVGTSAGGARAKAVIAWNPQTNQIKSGQFEAPAGFEHWLLKFDGMGEDRGLGPSQEYGRIEYAYHLMAKQAGITMTQCRLLEENGRAHFMTKRFDRESGDIRHHIQTLCAMNHLDFKKKGTNAYAQLFRTIQDLNLPYEAKEEAFRRMVFNVMGKNCDDHTKNLSFRLRQGHSWELAPAYDITFAHDPSNQWLHQHLMSVNGKFKDFTKEDLLTEAERFGVGTASAVIDRVQAAILEWPAFAKNAGVSVKERNRIQALLLPLQ